MNQKANSVADLAAVLLQQERGPTTKQIERSEKRVKQVEKLKRQKGADKVKKKPVLAPELGGTEGVMIRWANILDAEFAETWPVAVVHDILGKSRYTAAFPLAKGAAVTDKLQRLQIESEEPGTQGAEDAIPLVQRVAPTQPMSASQSMAPP